MNRFKRLRATCALTVFAVVFAALAVSSYRQESATTDEPENLTAGYAILTRHDYRLDPVHPPLVRMWAALPLWAMHGVSLETNSNYWLPVQLEFFCQEFMYQKNDADRLLYAARFMIVLLGVLLGAFLFRWAQELYGFWPAALVLLLYATEPNILAHTRLVTTDFGVTCFMFAALYFLWRTCQHLTLTNLVGLVVFFVFAQLSKFSALSLWPMLFVLLAISVLRRMPWPCRIGAARELTSRVNKLAVALSMIALLSVASYAAIWAAYGFRYAPAPQGSGLVRLITEPWRLAGFPRTAQVMNWLDDRHLLPNAYAQGFLACQALAQKRLAFFAGRTSEVGWWYYFPIAFLLKTPISLLILFFGGVLLALARREEFINNNAFILVPVAVYLTFAMTSRLNIGLRHILPIYPFVLLVAGKTVALLWASRRKILHVVLGALCLFQIEETAFVYPHYLAFFNQFIGGPRNGCKWLADSNIDWGQDLKLLKEWMDQHDVKAVNLSYFGHVDPAYYGIHCFYLPPVPFFVTGRDTGPRLPGYVAVSVQNLLGCSVDPPRPDLYKKLLESEPVAVIGYSIRVYWVDRPWW